MAQGAEKAIAGSLWMEVDDAAKPSYANKFRDVRVALRNKGVYDGRILKLMKKVRCKGVTDGECADTQE